MKPEARLSRDVRDLLTQAGFAVWSSEQGYRKDRGGTRTSPGIPDLIVAGQGRTFMVELKAGKRPKLTVAQEVFRKAWTENGGVSLVWRSVDDAWSWLVGEGIIREAVRT